MSTSRASHRFGLTLGLFLMLGLVYGAQRYFEGLSTRHGPAALEPIAHPGAQAIAFTPDGKHLISVGGSHLRRWDAATGAFTEESLVGRGLYRDDYRSVSLDDHADLCVANTGDSVYA